MNCLRVLFSQPRRVAPGLLILLAALVAVGWAPAQGPTSAKRPLRHSDYDTWRTLQPPVMSRNGQYLAYNVMPMEGDGEFVIRHLPSGKEHRNGRGKLVAPSTAGEAESSEPTPRPTGAGRRPTPGGGAGAASAVTHQFTPDSKSIVFVQIPTRADVERARAEKKKPDEMPRTAVVQLDLASGKIGTRLEGVTTFMVGGTGAGILLYRKGSRPETKPTPEEKPTKPGSGSGGATAERPVARTFGSDLILRDLATGKDRVLADVLDYSLTRDGKTLVYTVASRQEETNGVYTLSPPEGPAAPILTGKGRYTRPSWDEKQTQLVFCSDREDQASKSPRLRVYHWARQEPVRQVASTSSGTPSGGGSTVATSTGGATPPGATVTAPVDLFGPSPTGLRTGWVVNDRGGFSFSPDGGALYFSTGPAPTTDPEKPVTARPTTPPRRPGPAGATQAPADENKVGLDLWHWKDDYIQPMQKIRATGEQNRTYRAVYYLRDKVFRQLSDENADANPAPEGDWATWVDDRKYRHLSGYGPSLSDIGFVNMRTGEKRGLVEGSVWGVAFSPHGRYATHFDGKDWHAITPSNGKKVNLTGKLAVRFAQDEWDMPSEAPPYGIAGWSTDEKQVLIYDRYDIWNITIETATAQRLTDGRATQTVFRVVRLPQEDAPEGERGLDLNKPLLLKAENQRTRDEGFFRLEPGRSEPRLLVMAARHFGPPIKARDGETLLLMSSTFSDGAEYYATTPEFRELRKVTETNPQKANLLWGKSDLIRYKSLDGVDLSGVLIRPENFDPSKKYPLLVYIYERLSQSLHNSVSPSAGTSINPAYYASNGYLVLMPDITYTVGSPGQSALKCVLPAIQAVVDRGGVDEAAIGIQGHSWGGYQIAYMVTQTTRFKAAIAGAPVSNMVSAYDGIRWGTGLPRQFQYERTQSRIGGTLWQYPTRFIENSPIFMADRVKTPLLMLHNDQDDAVPWYQGIEYFLALRRLGKECYLCNYNGELHGLRRRPNQRDWTVRMQQFLDHHLKGEPAPEWMVKGVPYLERDKEKEGLKKVFSSP